MKTRAPTRGRVLIKAAALVAASAIPQLAAGAANAAPAHSASHAASHSAGAVPHYRHIAVVLYTDHGYSNIIGNKFAPTKPLAPRTRMGPRSSRVRDSIEFIGAAVRF